MPLQLMNKGDYLALRALLLPSLSAEKAAATLPESIIESPGVGGHAEGIVLGRLGTDWVFFANTNPANPMPAYYAQGNAASARALCHDALIQFCGAQLLAVGFVQQLVPVGQATVGTNSRTIGVNWEQRRADLEARGYHALFMLRRPIPVPGRTFPSPAAGASGQLAAAVRPSRIGMPRRECRSWDSGRGWDR